MTELPTGTLTLLFSDIEGSTVLLHRLGERWGEALSAQRAILRAAFDRHDGSEMGTEGDSFFVVFRSARNAIAAAVDGQRGLQEHSWPGDARVRVRIGIHTGEPERHEDGYIGEDVHRAARIGSTANGNQIVISGATRRLVSELADVEIRDLGHHRLKDLAGEEHLFDVVAPGLATEFPPLRSLGKTATLPTASSPLVGRSADLRAVGDLFADEHTRLVTLTGPGGAGKTRLATAAAAELEPGYPDGVYFVGLHTVDSSELMWLTIAEALDIAADGTPADRVAGQLADRGALLVLDNLEQIPDADVVVTGLLSAAPRVRVLAASRRPLLLAGEREFVVRPLGLPESGDVDAVMSSAAVQMFVHRAQMVRPAFELTDANRADVAELCRRLDGLPLALELAAAHSRLLSPRALLSRIGGQLGAGLTAADRPERQRTLGATIAWSYDLLDETERAVFRRLGVFRNSCDLDAVGAVAGEDGVEVLDVASRLVGTSLVRVDEAADGEPRIALLQTIRTFALERLEESGEAPRIRLRHARWCIDVADKMISLLRGPLHTIARDGIGTVEDDIRAALDWSLRPAGADGRERVEVGQQLLALAYRYWYRFGTTNEARVWQERGAAVADDEDSEANVTLLHGFGISVLQQAEVDAAVALFERSLAMAQRLDRRDLEARAVNDLAIARRQSGDYTEAMRLLKRSLEISRSIDSRIYEATSLSNLVVVHIDLGQYGEAAQAAHEAMEANRRNGDMWGVAIDRLNYTAAILKSEGPRAAHPRYVEWADEIASFRDRELSIDLMELGASIAAGIGESALAARLLAGADGEREKAKMPRSTAEQTLMDEWLDMARTAMSAGEWQEAYASGAGLTPDRGIELVRALAVPAVPGSAAIG